MSTIALSLFALIACVPAQRHEAALSELEAWKTGAWECVTLAREMGLEAQGVIMETETLAALAEVLRLELGASEARVHELSGKVIMELDGDVIFEKGSWNLTPDGEVAVADVAKALRAVGEREIRVEGYAERSEITDEDPGAWRLSAQRAGAVVALLVDQFVDPANIAAVGFGAFREAPRAPNRRVDVVLIPRLELRYPELDPRVAECLERPSR